MMISKEEIPRFMYCTQSQRNFSFTVKNVNEFIKMIKWIEKNNKGAYRCQYEFDVGPQCFGHIEFFLNEDAILFKLNFDSGDEYKWEE